MTDRAGEAREGDCPRNWGIEDNDPCLRGEDPALIGDGTAIRKSYIVCSNSNFDLEIVFIIRLGRMHLATMHAFSRLTVRFR